jgi:hypothetical protein
MADDVEDKIARIEEFKAALTKWRESGDPKVPRMA